MHRIQRYNRASLQHDKPFKLLSFKYNAECKASMFFSKTHYVSFSIIFQAPVEVIRIGRPSLVKSRCTWDVNFLAALHEKKESNKCNYI